MINFFILGVFNDYLSSKNRVFSLFHKFITSSIIVLAISIIRYSVNNGTSFYEEYMYVATGYMVWVYWSEVMTSSRVMKNNYDINIRYKVFEQYAFNLGRSFIYSLIVFFWISIIFFTDKEFSVFIQINIVICFILLPILAMPIMLLISKLSHMSRFFYDLSEPGIRLLFFTTPVVWNFESISTNTLTGIFLHYSTNNLSIDFLRSVVTV
jgi:ABC-type polysaccharide/polyol phosphate export permease